MADVLDISSVETISTNIFSTQQNPKKPSYKSLIKNIKSGKVAPTPNLIYVDNSNNKQKSIYNRGLGGGEFDKVNKI